MSNTTSLGSGGSGGGGDVTGPASSVANDIAIFADNSGKLLADSGVQIGSLATLPIDLATQVTGILPIANGGTNISTYAQGDLVYSSATNTLAKLAKDTNATRYLSNSGTNNNPAWAQVSLTNGVTGTLPVTNGGTNITSYAVGAIVRATGATTLAGLAPSAKIGSVLKSQGTGLSPAYSASAFNDAPPTDNRFLKSLSNDWVASTYSMPASLSPNRLIISNGSGDMSTFAMTNNTYLTYQSGFVSDTTNLRITASGLQVIGDLTGTPTPVSYRGEQIASVVNSGSAITLSTGIAQNIASIVLTPGVWDINALALFNGTLTGSQLALGISTTANSLAGVTFGDNATATPTMPTALTVQNLTIPQYRVVISSNTTHYLVASATFSAGTCTTYGRLSAVRVG